MSRRSCPHVSEKPWWEHAGHGGGCGTDTGGSLTRASWRAPKLRSSILNLGETSARATRSAAGDARSSMCKHEAKSGHKSEQTNRNGLAQVAPRRQTHPIWHDTRHSTFDFCSTSPPISDPIFHPPCRPIFDPPRLPDLHKSGKCVRGVFFSQTRCERLLDAAVEESARVREVRAAPHRFEDDAAALYHTPRS